MNNYIKKYDKLNEIVFSAQLNNGLNVVIIPKKDFKKFFCSFTTSFGGFDNKFVNPKTKKVEEIPFGTAHFLEHKLFEMKDGTDATEVFSRIGIDSNAFTDYNQTSYIITGTSNQDKAIEYLLDFVQSPYFTKENIKKEQGIIIQEYNMYADYPSDLLQKKLMNNMYNKIPYFKDIVGDIDSIKKIDIDALNLAYNTFYQPSNMIFLAIGNFDIEHIFNLIKKNQEKKNYKKQEKIQRIVEKEEGINLHDDVIKANISCPKASIGIKINNIYNEDNNLLEIKFKILLELICGSYSYNYQKMLDDELINSSFRYSVRIDYDENNKYNYGYIKIFSDTLKPQEFINYMKNELLKIKKFNFDKDEFDKMKKALIGSIIMLFNDLENMGVYYIETYLKNSNVFETMEKVVNLRIEDMDCIKDIFIEKNISTIIMNKND